MKRGVFVTGTDTGVGKTVASAALIAALRASGLRVAPMKPVAAGSLEDTHALMAAAGLPADAQEGVTPLLLREAMAPHIAARHEGRAIALEPLLAAFRRLAGDFAVIEGVGGFRVPLGPGFDTIDLARAIGLPVVLVVGLRLGCLNHALLTRDAIAAASLPFAGWIANTIDPAMAAIDENIETLDALLGAPRLGRLPWQPGASAAEMAAHLDVGTLVRA